MAVEIAINQFEITKIKIKGYGHSFAIGGTLFLIGLALNASGVAIPKIPAFPDNLYIGILFINFLLIGYFYFRTNPVIKWLMSVPASISAISFYTILILTMGFIPQQTGSMGWIAKMGFDNILTTWTFQITQVFFMTTLGMVVLKRTIPFKIENWGFILNHLGLWLIIFAVALGTGDFKRLTLPLYEGQTSITAFDRKGVGHDLPFAIHLVDFDMEEYPTKIVLANKSSGKIVASSFLSLESTVSEIYLNNWQISFAKHEHLPDHGNLPQTYVVQAKNGSTTIKDVLSTENRKPALLHLNENEALALLPPEPKKYISNINLSDGKKDVNMDVLVNKPAAFGGWKIYQVSYDEKAGKDSDYSVLEVIRDPWLPLVYVGVLMLILGAVYLIWSGNRLKIKDYGME